MEDEEFAGDEAVVAFALAVARVKQVLKSSALGGGGVVHPEIERTSTRAGKDAQTLHTVFVLDELHDAVVEV